MSPTLPAVLIEAFAATPLQGNGAAVVLLEQPAEAAWMQGLAGSLQQSETAFLHRRGDGQWQLRWFTPTCEVPLCGHATLAATLALAHWGQLQPGEALQLASRSGALAVSLVADQPGHAALVLPGGGMHDLPIPAELEPQLGLAVLRYWGSALGYRVALIEPGADLAGLANPAARLTGQDRQGLVVMQALEAAAPQLLGEPCDYQLRFFAPGLGIDEDPVTGSAHALVAPWWMEQLGRPRVRGWQVSPRRGGMLCEHAGPDLVRLTGSGQLLWDGRINAAGSGCDPSGWDNCVHR